MNIFKSKSKEQKVIKFNSDPVDEVVRQISVYAFDNPNAGLDLRYFVEYSGKDIEDGFYFSGLQYGVKVMDGEQEIVKLITKQDSDACFVSGIASKRRIPHLNFAKAVAEYIVSTIDGIHGRNPLINTKLTIKEDIAGRERLFTLDTEMSV